MAENDLDDLLRRYDPMVRSRAGDFMRRLGKLAGIVTFEDLYQAGITGIIEAYKSYDPSRGVPISAFVSLRIMYAVYSEGSRGVLANKQAIDEAAVLKDDRRALEGIYGRSVTDAELADFIGSDEEELLRRLTNIQSRMPQAVPIEEELCAARGSTDDQAYRNELKYFIDCGMEYLTPVERKVLRGVYAHGMTLEEVGLKLGVSRQRANVIRDDALAKIRRYLDEQQVHWHGLDE
jgi:RNA polymerase sigma factor for flagellar operon FliA